MSFDFQTQPERLEEGSLKWRRVKAELGSEKMVVPFCLADMELLNPEPILEGLKHYLEQKPVLGYTEATDRYYEAFQAWMKRRHRTDVPKEWIIPMACVVPALYEAVRSFSDKGDSVIIMPPVYPPFFRAVTQNDRELALCPLKEEQGRYEIDFERFEQLASQEQCRLLIFCSPHNPVGRVWTKLELSRLMELCELYQITVVSDEIHSDLIQEGHQHQTLLNLNEASQQRVMVCNAPSKTFNLAGAQLAQVMIPNASLRQRYLDEHLKSGYNLLNAFSYQAATLAYEACEAWLEALLTHLQKNHEILREGLGELLPELRVLPLEGTYLAWIDCRSLNLDWRERRQFLREKAKLFLESGADFGAEGRGFERFNLACPEASLRQALQCLKRALKR